MGYYRYSRGHTDPSWSVIELVILLVLLAVILIGMGVDYNSKQEPITLIVERVDRVFIKIYHYYVYDESGNKYAITRELYEILKDKKGCTLTIMFHGTLFRKGAEIVETPFCPNPS